jgi:hypothetical protein
MRIINFFAEDGYEPRMSEKEPVVEGSFGNARSCKLAHSDRYHRWLGPEE